MSDNKKPIDWENLTVNLMGREIKVTPIVYENPKATDMLSMNISFSRKDFTLDDLRKAKALMDKMEIPTHRYMIGGYRETKVVLNAKRFPRKIKAGIKSGKRIVNITPTRCYLSINQNWNA